MDKIIIGAVVLFFGVAAVVYWVYLHRLSRGLDDRYKSESGLKFGWLGAVVLASKSLLIDENRVKSKHLKDKADPESANKTEKQPEHPEK